MNIGHINIGRARWPFDDPKMSGFTDHLDRLHDLAESMDGFIWRLKNDAADLAEIPEANDPLTLWNVSVWRDVASLHGFVYHPDHAEFIRRGHEWFDVDDSITFALWPQDPKEMPSLADAYQRLYHLRDHGPSPDAFSFKDARKFLA